MQPVEYDQSQRKRGKRDRRRQKQLYIGIKTQGNFVGDWVGEVKE
jgi:hypothetical protein